ncbi:MAG: DUF2267 domain-containing protein [Chloroflexi bacterium]|nr:DUF2267 domain-containing protein [Chloroflexota bacterium]
MDELVEMVVKETGLPEAQARKAAEAVVKVLKEKLPAPIASQIDGFLEGGGATDVAGDLLKKGMGLFGKK